MLDLTQDQVAKLAGISQTSVYKLTSGKAKQTRKIVQLAQALQCRAEWLENGTEPMEGYLSGSMREHFSTQNTAEPLIGLPIIEWDDPTDLPGDTFVIVPRYDVHAAAGNGHVVYEEMAHGQGQAYRADWLKRKGLRGRTLRCIYAKGDSMNPVICDGFSILLDSAQTAIQEGKIYVIRYGDEIRVKYLHKRPDGGLIIRSANSGEFPDVQVEPEHMKHIEILGRVVHVAGDF